MSTDVSTIKNRLIARTREALDAYYNASDPSPYVALYADKATAFDPWAGGRKGDSALLDYLMSFAGSIPHLEYEILNPRVDLVGDAAVFTFGLDVRDPASGATLAIWNTTQVHDLAADGLDLVHSHWSYAVPPSEYAG